MPVQLHYVPLIMGKTNTVDLLSAVSTSLISVTRMIKYKIHPLLFHKFHQKLANSDVTGNTELYRLFTTANSIVDAISFIRRIVL